MLQRKVFEKSVKDSIDFNPVTAILGARQCGKTTLAKMVSKSYQSIFFDLEDPSDFELLKSSPKQTLKNQNGLVIIDEIQRNPELFPLLRVLSDEVNSGRKFLILGSASHDLIQNSSESLAGRVGFVDLTGFRLDETGSENFEALWLKGGFPRSYLAKTHDQSFSWRNDFIRTFLERDVAQFGFNIPPVPLRQFWMMLAHFHGQVWSGAEFARSMGVSEPTVKRYLDILTGTFMLRSLQPWHENLKKRQVKSPKIYIRDSGILHALLSLPNNEILSHVKLGASWEGFIIEQLIQRYESRDFYYWRTHTGVELDLLILKGGKRIGFEVKFSEIPKITRSMHIAIEDLNLDQLFLVYRGTRQLQLEDKIFLLPADKIFNYEAV